MKYLFVNLFLVFFITSCTKSIKHESVSEDNYISNSEIYDLGNSNENSILLDSLVKKIYNKKLAEIDLNEFFQTKDTILESEGVEWPGINLLIDDTLHIILESSWQSRDSVKRMVILTNKVKTSDGITVGSIFSDFNKYFDKDIPSFPDGYFGLKSKYDRRVTFFFNIDNFNELIYVIPDWNEIPSDLRIKTIIVDF